MRKTYHGACHCGQVQYEAAAPIRYVDGLQELWHQEPAVTSYL